jgi:hypothetical protein
LAGTASASALAQGGRGLLELNGSSDAVYSYRSGGTLVGYSLGSSSEIRLASSTAIPISFYTNSTERLRITSAGLLGLGTSSPVRKLVVSNSGAEGLEIGPGESANLNFQLHYNRSSSAYVTNKIDAADHLFFTSATERARITSAGLVGIGTTGPAANLDVRGTGSASVEILRVGNGTKFLGLGTEGTNYSWIQSFAATPLYINPLGNNTILNSGGGNVGIGTTSASSLLTLRSTAADNTAGISMQGASAGNITNLYNTLTDFVVQHAASEAFRVDASRRLLVGTSSARTNVYYTTVATTPSVQFESAGSTYNGLSLINYSASGYSPVLTLGLSASNTQGTNTAVSNSFDLGAINFTGNDGTNFRTGASIVATNDQASAWAVGDCPTRLVFSTTADGPGNTPTERMRITNDGNVTISSTAYTSARLGIGGYANGDRLGVYMRASTDPATPFDFRNAANTTVGSIATTASATAFNTSSDYRLKENVTPITNGITRFQQLKPSQFNFIADPGHTVDGFLAHEAQAVVPECVTGTKDAVDADGKPVYQGIDQSKLVPLLTAALQEAIAKIEALEADVAALKGA